MHESVVDRVGNRRIGNHLVPVFDIDLARHDCRSASLPVIEDLEQVAALIDGRVGKPEVIEDQRRY